MSEIDLSYFQDEDGNALPRPETKNITALERVIALDKPQAVLDKFASLVAVGEQWDWFDLYQVYLTECQEIEECNTDKPLTYTDDLGESITLETKEYPVMPLRPVIRSASEILNEYVIPLRKKEYPPLEEFAEAFVEYRGGNNSLMNEYLEKCANVKIKYPKAL